MERELMPDYRAEAFYRHLIPESVFEGPEEVMNESSRDIVCCKKVGPDMYSVRYSVPGITEDGTYTDRCVHMMKFANSVFTF